MKLGTHHPKKKERNATNWTCFQTTALHSQPWFYLVFIVQIYKSYKYNTFSHVSMYTKIFLSLSSPLSYTDTWMNIMYTCVLYVYTLCVCVCERECVYTLCVCVCVWERVSACVCMYAWVYVCAYVCMCVCVCVCVCRHTVYVYVKKKCRRLHFN